MTALTIAERQSLYRARRTLEGKTEVRGIYLQPEQHAALRAIARTQINQTNRKVPLMQPSVGALPQTKNMIFVPAHMALVETDAPTIAVKLGEKGYWPVYHPSHEELNERYASEAVLRSAVQASMFGWDAPIAREAIEWLAEADDASAA